MGQLEDMHLFTRVVDAGGISRAAEQMDLAKSAVSKRLADLESRLGTRLIQRTTRTSHLTNAGKLYYDRAQRILEDVAEINGLASDNQSSLDGHIKLAAPLSFGLCHLSSAIDAFLKQHTGITIDVDFSDRHIDLIEEGFDLSFKITRELGDSNLIAQRIAPIKLHLCASPDYLERHGVPATPEDLNQHQLLRFNLTAPKWEFHDGDGKKISFPIKAGISANNGDFLHRMAVAGHGIAHLPTFLSWQSLATGKLVKVLPEYPIDGLTAYTIYPHSRYLTQRSRLFIEYLKEYFGDNSYWDQAIHE